jgi:hypothetical protein
MNLNSNTKPEISTENRVYHGKRKELKKHKSNREATAKEATVAVMEWGFFFLTRSAPPRELCGCRDKDFCPARRMSIAGDLSGRIEWSSSRGWAREAHSNMNQGSLAPSTYTIRPPQKKGETPLAGL